MTESHKSPKSICLVVPPVRFIGLEWIPGLSILSIKYKLYDIKIIPFENSFILNSKYLFL